MAISQSLLGTRKAHIRNLCPFNMPALVIGGINARSCEKGFANGTGTFRSAGKHADEVKGFFFMLRPMHPTLGTVAACMIFYL